MNAMMGPTNTATRVNNVMALRSRANRVAMMSLPPAIQNMP